MTISETPEIFYKYRNFDARAISMLANNQIYFASPLDFNDPFDCMVHEDMFETRAESIELLANIKHNIPYEAIDRESTKQLMNDTDLKSKINEVKIATQNELRQQLEKFGVVALSTCNNSILMWSHYADNHKGFCIGFKNNLGLDKSCIVEVSYSNIRSNDFILHYIASQNMTPEENYQRLLKELIFTKYTDWKYEQEWRIIGNKGIGIYSAEHIDRIIFGLQMPQEERNAIQYLLKDKNVKFFEAVKSKRYFAVDIRQLDSN